MRLTVFKFSLLALGVPASAQQPPEIPANAVSSEVTLGSPRASADAATQDVSTLPNSTTVVGSGSGIDARCLNPQPLPPRHPSVAGIAEVRPGDRVALNPQPLPPREPSIDSVARVRLGERVALKPQPLPPREMSGAAKQGC